MSYFQFSICCAVRYTVGWSKSGLASWYGCICSKGCCIHKFLHVWQNLERSTNTKKHLMLLPANECRKIPSMKGGGLEACSSSLVVP